MLIGYLMKALTEAVLIPFATKALSLFLSKISKHDKEVKKLEEKIFE